MVSIVEYAYELASNCRIDSHDVIKSAPVDNSRALSDMIDKCVRKLHSIPEIIYIVHSLPFIKGKESDEVSYFPGVPVIYLSGMPCAVTHMAVKIAVSQLETGKYNRILIVGADKAYSTRERSFFGTIMGDMVLSMMLERGDGFCEILASNIDTVLYAVEGENSNPEQISKYRSTLPLLIRDAYMRCLSQCELESVDFIAPHTSARAIWDVLTEMIHIDRSRILDENIVNTGHFNSNDSFYHYFTHCENDTINHGQTAMLINPGFGGTRGCTVLRRK